MKLEVDPQQFAEIRKQAMEDEALGIDPGLSWACIYPGEAEIEFVVVDGQPAPSAGKVQS